MAVKNTTQVLIGGKIMTLSGYESEEYLQKVAYYINNKMTELGQLPGYSRQSLETKHTLLDLNVADDLNVGIDDVNIKATTTEKLGFEGRGEGISATAVVLLK